MFRGDIIILNTSGNCKKLLKLCGAKKTIQKTVKIESAKEKAESVKTEQSLKINFFEALPWLKSKIARIIKVSYTYTYKDHAQKFSEFTELPTENSAQIRDSKEICFCAVIQI